MKHEPYEIINLSNGGFVLTKSSKLRVNRYAKDPAIARRDYQEWLKNHPAEQRRAKYPVLVCRCCETSKATDGSDDKGGFSPNASRTTGWASACRWCMKIQAGYRRKGLTPPRIADIQEESCNTLPDQY